MAQNRLFKRPHLLTRWIPNWVFVNDPDAPPDPPDDPTDPPEDPPENEQPVVGFYVNTPVPNNTTPDLSTFLYGVIPTGYVVKSQWVPMPTLQNPNYGEWLIWWQPN